MSGLPKFEALAELKAGRIDAMFSVAGCRIKLFSEGVSDKAGPALVPITAKSITDFYPRAEIPARTYSWQPSRRHRRGEVGPHVLRRSPPGLRDGRQVRQEESGQDGPARHQRAPEVESGRHLLSPEGLGAV